jgi:hypothetical protein
MSRRWLLITSVVLGLGVGGCAEPGLEEQARDDAHRKVEAAYGDIAGPPRIWPAEALGRRAVAEGFEVLAIDGTDFGSGGPGVTMVVRVVGQGVGRDLYGEVVETVEVPLCFRLRFVELHVVVPPELVECTDTPPITYPSLPPAPRLPDRDAVIEALTGVPADASSVRDALETLDLDDRLRVDLQVSDGVVGVGLRAVGPFNQRAGCLLVRVAPDGVEAWHLSRAQDQPGELSCGGNEAIVRAGIRPPH